MMRRRRRRYSGYGYGIGGARGSSAPVLVRFASPGEFASEADRLVPSERKILNPWHGDKSWADLVRDSRQGDASQVAAALALLDKVSAGVVTPRAAWVGAPVGAYPIVAEALSGRPDSMRRRVSSASELGPVRLVLDLTCSAGVGYEMLTRRGAAYLALVLKLQETRPVELAVISALGPGHGNGEAYVALTSLGVSPVNVALCCHALASVGFNRGLGYRLLQSMGAGDGWAWGQHPENSGTRAAYVAHMRSLLALGEADVFVPPVHVRDESMTDPVKFVRRSLVEHGVQVEGEVD